MALIDNKKAYDIVAKSWIINCLKVYKISDEVINCIEKTMKTWKVELIAGERNLTEAKIQRGIFLGDAISTVIFIIAMIPLNYILRKCTAGYKLSRSWEKIVHLCRSMTSNYLQKMKKELETLIHTFKIYRQNIEMEFSIEKCAMLVMEIRKRHLTDGMELPNQDKIRTLGEKKNRQILGKLGGWHHQTSGDERKNP